MESETHPGRFGEYGGRYVPEILISALSELDCAFARYSKQEEFRQELSYLLSEFAGRKTPLYFAKNLTEHAGGARIYLKREDLVHGGAHKLNNTLGQALLAKKMGKKKIIAETGAGQHGVASAIAAAAMGLECDVYMGIEDIERQKLNVFRMNLMGARVVPVDSGSRTLKDATNEAMRAWAPQVEETHYLVGSVVGPHPYPEIVREFQRVIGKETKEQILEKEGRLPDAIVACVGGGSNAMGIFTDFIDDPVRLIAVEAGGKGIESGKHGASLYAGSDGVLQGMYTRVLQDIFGQIKTTYSVSAGLDYSGVGPQLSHLAKTKRLECSYAVDDDALEAFRLLSSKEGILPALESSHAVAQAIRFAGEMDVDDVLVVNLSGRGDKDVFTVAKTMGVKI